MEALIGRGFREARRLGHSWAGPEHMVLAVLRGDEDDLGRRALVSLGVTADAYEVELLRVLARSRPRPTGEGSEPADQTTGNPAGYALEGWASACAHILGDGVIRGSEVLLGVVYRGGWCSSVLARVGAPPDRLVARLGELGVPLPAVAPPAPEPARRTQVLDIPRDQLDDAIALLRERFPPSPTARWGFNYEGEGGAYLTAEPGIDLETLMAEVAEKATTDGPTGVSPEDGSGL